MRHDSLALPPGDDAGEAARDRPAIPDRRRSPRRRLRDRIASLDKSDNPGLRARPRVEALLLLVDDDLRQTALAIGGVESFVAASITLLEKPDLGAGELSAHAAADAVLDQLDALTDNIANLRRRMISIAALIE